MDTDEAYERWDQDRRRKYPRGEGPSWNSPEDFPDPEVGSLEAHDPKHFFDDPGFTEDHTPPPDPDDWHHDRKEGGILTQREQFAYSPLIASYDGKGLTESELKGHPKAPVGGDVHRVKGLYGEDENDPYDVYAKPGPDGKGWDVIRPVGR
jgi:hypothetical protein